MSKKNRIGWCILLTAVLALIPVGQYVGGLLFIRLARLPLDILSVTTLHDYWLQYGAIKSIQIMLGACFFVSALVPVMPLIVMGVALSLKKEKKLHGDARFATEAEIRKAGLLNDKEGKYPGVLVGQYKGKFLFFSGQQFIFLAAPPRSKKGVSLVIPNTLHYRDSMVLFDPKFEAWKKSSGYRSQHGQACYLFAPGAEDFKSHRWNPLSYIRRDHAFRVGDTLKIAMTLYPESHGDNKFFDKNAQTLFLGMTLYLLDTPDESVSLARVLALATPETGESLGEWIKHTIALREQNNQSLSPACVSAWMTFAQTDIKTQSNILPTFLAPLSIMIDPVTAAATSADDFDLRDVRKKRMTIYIGIQQGSIAQFSGLLNLFFSQLIQENTRELPEDNPALKYQCLILLDELSLLGKIKVIQDTAGLIAGFNMRLLLVFQNKSQLEDRSVYGKEGAKSLLGTIALQIAYAPRDYADAKELSDMLGYTTVEAKSTSRQSGRAGRSESESQQKRALLLPQEVQEIGSDKELIFLENCKPILADKITWYTDAAFKDRADWPVPDVPILSLKKIASDTFVTRPVTAGEADSMDVSHIVNAKEILDVIMKKIPFDLAPVT